MSSFFRLMEKIPVTIVSGFLGSGKTTAIIKLLGDKANDEQWAVIINEFGKISIDSQTLNWATTSSGSVFDISGGCICCSAKGYFRENLEQIVRSGNYSRIIIEPSGLGGIDMVSEIVGINPDLQLMPVICVVDILGIGNPRLQMNPIYRMQIAKADIIAISKCDLLPNIDFQARLIDQFKSTFPDKQDCLTLSVDLLQVLTDMDFRVKKEQDKYGMLFGTMQDLTDSNYQQENYKFGADKIFDAERLTHFFNNHPSIIRAKGFVQTKTGWQLFNFTLSGASFEPCPSKNQNELIVIAEKSASLSIQSLEWEIEKSCLLNNK